MLYQSRYCFSKSVHLANIQKLSTGKQGTKDSFINYEYYEYKLGIQRMSGCNQRQKHKIIMEIHVISVISSHKLKKVTYA